MTETNKRLPKVPTQQRSQERFEFLLDCAEELLNDTRPEELSIYDLADKSALPAQSIYRLFPSAAAIIHALAKRYIEEIAEINAALDLHECDSWQQVVTASFDSSCRFYREHPNAMRLILGSGASREIRATDRASITHLAERAAKNLSHWIHENKQAALVPHLEIAIDICDAIWSQSFDHFSDITPFYRQEGLRAVIAYLELYLPKYNLK